MISYIRPKMCKEVLLVLAIVLTAAQGGRNASFSLSDMGEFKCEVTVDHIRRVLYRGEKLIDNTTCFQHQCTEKGVDLQPVECNNHSLQGCKTSDIVQPPNECCPICATRTLHVSHFSKWSEWSQCSASCGPRIRVKTRKCIVYKETNYIECTGELLAIQNCTKINCPINCEFEWSSWSACSVTCGGGTKTRYAIISKMPQNGGRPCKRRDTKKCGETPCSDKVIVNCVFEWSSWSDCSATCGSGRRMRYPIISQPAQNKGQSCPQNETVECIAKQCPPIDCEYNWAERCVNCMVVKYPIITQQPRNGGQICPDSREELKMCGYIPCPCKRRNIGPDFDCDGWVDSCDNCPHAFNPDQLFVKNHNIGICCDSDPDEDGHISINDNCPYTKNQDQADIDRDGVGDVCDLRRTIRGSVIKDYYENQPYCQKSHEQRHQGCYIRGEKASASVQMMQRLLKMLYEN